MTRARRRFRMKTNWLNKSPRSSQNLTAGKAAIEQKPTGIWRFLHPRKDLDRPRRFQEPREASLREAVIA